jgi:hypothetical protein
MGLNKRHLRAGMAILALSLLWISCSSEKKEQAAQPIDVFQAGFVPSADFVARVDFEAFRNTPAYKNLVKDDEATEEAASESVKAQGKVEQLEEIRRITGLTPDDIVAVIISADLDTVDLGGEETEPDISKVNAVLAVQLSKSLPNTKLVEAAKAIAGKDNRGTAEEVQVAGQPAVKLSSEDEDEPDLFVTSGPGEQIVFMAPNTASLEGALKRARSGEFSGVPAGLETVRGTLPAGAQFKLAFLTSPELRQGIREQLEKAKEEPDAMMLSGMVEPFKDLQSLAVGVECGDGLRVGIGCDLGSPESANKVATMLQTMVLPMVTGGLAQSLGKEPQEISDRLEIKAEGQALKIGVKFTQEDIATLQKFSDE